MYKIWMCVWFATMLILFTLSSILPKSDSIVIAFGNAFMALIALIFIAIVYYSNRMKALKMIGGNLAAISVKFILTGLMLIVFILFFKEKIQMHFFYLLIIIFIYSIISYTGAYYSRA